MVAMAKPTPPAAYSDDGSFQNPTRGPSDDGSHYNHTIYTKHFYVVCVCTQLHNTVCGILHRDIQCSIGMV